ncbi:hypothetical protein [Paenibacillus cremeus]|uniref:Uncharacterized protein n=1 Tax=Paenibacillus cremeus TaxID=2163881 RepID=A0A559K418_9BACL|nr:hypothetical protein [Paenibacillus cremeus]TVY06856.1 hypothetical protein FPZ49_27045 [Paenibacillus cremeus]
MAQVLHINIADTAGCVYCCLRNKVVQLDQEQKENYCQGCGMFAGFADGLGVECLWIDMRPVNNPHVVTEPLKEFTSNQLKQIYKPKP